MSLNFHPREPNGQSVRWVGETIKHERRETIDEKLHPNVVVSGYVPGGKYVRFGVVERISLYLRD